MRRKNLMLVLAGIFLVVTMPQVLAQEVNVNAGDTEFVEIGFNDPIYVVTGNSSNMNGLNVTEYNNTHIKVSVHKAFKPDNFTIHFFDKDDLSGNVSGEFEDNLSINDSQINNTEIEDPKQGIPVNFWTVFAGLGIMFIVGYAGFVLHRIYSSKPKEKSEENSELPELQ